MPQDDRRQLFGLQMDPLTMGQVLDRLDDAISERRPVQVGVVNAAKLVHMRADRALFDSVQGADLILADGMSVVWASRLLRQPLPERVAGFDLMIALLRRGEERGYRFYFLGATDDVNAAAVEAIHRSHPKARIVGRHHGYFEDSEEAVVADEIAASGADVLFVGMTSPRKEVFIARWGEGLGVPVCHGVGGSFDILAGKVNRAPERWQRHGFEWLWRVVQEPRRLWKRYLVTNTRFGAMLARELIRTRRGQ